jgi:glucose-1-phosphate adenylyltransferase
MGRAYAYPFLGYWVDVGTIQAYWETSMALLEENPDLDLYDSKWVIHTRSEERPPVKCIPPGELIKSLASNGCTIYGTVINSVLSPGVRVEKGAVVRDSVIMNDTIVCAGASVSCCILDKEIEVGANARLGVGKDDTPNKLEPANINTGITIVGKRAHIPAGATIGRNCRIDPNTTQDNYESDEVPSGETVSKKLQ